MAARDDVVAAWQAVRQALENHARLGMRLQHRGLEMMNVGDDEGAVALIVQGVRIETEARLDIYRLERNKPRLN